MAGEKTNHGIGGRVNVFPLLCINSLEQGNPHCIKRMETVNQNKQPVRVAYFDGGYVFINELQLAELLLTYPALQCNHRLAH